MKHSLRYLLAVLACWLGMALSSQAQAPTWQWAKRPGTGRGNTSVVDASGNMYITGAFNDTIAFGSTLLTNVGPGVNNDVFVAKLAPNGVCLWAARAGGSAYDEATDIAVDAQGNVYVAGFFLSRRGVFGATTLLNNSPSSGDIFVAKLNSVGTWQWASSIASTEWDDVGGIAADATGNLYVTGGFGGSTATLGPFTLTNPGTGTDGFVAKLNATGQFQWAQGVSGSEHEFVSGVVVDNAGAAYVSGAFRSPVLTFGATTLNNTSSGFADGFIAGIAPNGTWQWAQAVGGVRGESVNNLLLDSGGDLYVIGIFSSPQVQFGSHQVTLSSTASYNDAYVARFSPASGWRWAVSAAGDYDDIPASLALDGQGGLYVAGYFRSPTLTAGSTVLNNVSPVSNPNNSSADLFVVKLLASNGSWQWAVSAGGPGFDFCGSVVALGSMVSIIGLFNSNQITLGPFTLPNSGGAGGYDVLLAGLSPLTGLPANADVDSFQLIPNPAHHTVTLTGATSPTADLIDATGRTVRTCHLEPGTSYLNLAGLSPGLYLVRAGHLIRRLVVE